MEEILLEKLGIVGIHVMLMSIALMLGLLRHHFDYITEKIPKYRKNKGDFTPV